MEPAITIRRLSFPGRCRFTTPIRTPTRVRSGTIQTPEHGPGVARFMAPMAAWRAAALTTIRRTEHGRQAERFTDGTEGPEPGPPITRAPAAMPMAARPGAMAAAAPAVVTTMHEPVCRGRPTRAGRRTAVTGPAPS